MKKKDTPDISCATNYVGIDIGFDGGITILNEYFVESFDFPLVLESNNKGKVTKRLYLEAIHDLYVQVIPANSVVLIESVHSMPNQGIVSAFSFGRQLGTIEAFMTAMTGSEPFYITPQKWRKVYPQLVTDEMLDLKKQFKTEKDKKKKASFKYQYKKKTKEQSIIVANNIFENNFLFSKKGEEFFTKNMDGQAESFLIAWYASIYL